MYTWDIPREKQSNSKRWRRTPAYTAFSTKNSQVVGKGQDKGKQLEVSEGRDKGEVVVSYVDSSGALS